MRIMGLDVGSKTVGVAISDPLGFTAQGLEIIPIDEDKGEFVATLLLHIVCVEVLLITLGHPIFVMQTSTKTVHLDEVHELALVFGAHRFAV